MSLLSSYLYPITHSNRKHTGYWISSQNVLFPSLLFGIIYCTLIDLLQWLEFSFQLQVGAVSPLEMGLHSICEALLKQSHRGGVLHPALCAEGPKAMSFQLPMNHINDPLKCTPEHPGDRITHFIMMCLLKNVL